MKPPRNYERIVMRGGGRGQTFTGFEPVQAQQQPGDKPMGLWYGIDDSWLAWCESEQQEWIGNRFYRLNVDTSKLLLIGRDMSLDEFAKKYHVNPPYYDEMAKKGLPIPENIMRFYIDWPEVTKRWSGIEIPFYSWRHRRELLWYYTWDVASGCIWKADALLGFERVGAPIRTFGSKDDEPVRVAPGRKIKIDETEVA